MAQNCKLRDLEVLVLDCQATHSDPVKGKIFEIAWIRTKASETFPKEEQAESHLVAFKDNEDLPRYISKITGILPGDFRFAIPAEDAWKRLQKSAQAAASENKAVLCPTIIHYSRYEEPFLRKLHREFCLETQFPFRIICTHQIVKQLLPGLPRKGLRAVCGYFGHPQPDARRSRNHVLGTAFIWAHLVSILEEQKKCLTLDDLICFLERPLSHPDRLNPVRVYPMAENFRKNTPDSPGLYRMFRSNGDLLYIGKAKSLKRRIADYFQKKGKHSEHILEMLSQAKSLSYSLTQTVFEAALRESDEIKALSPSYNIALRSSEGGPFFATTDLQSCRQKPDSLHRIGPLPSQKHIASLSSLMAIINGSCGRITPQVTAKALAADEEHIPDCPVFLKGIEEFKKHNQDRLIVPFTLQSAMKIGTFLWKERLIRLAEEQREAEEETEEAGVLKAQQPKKKKRSRVRSWSPEKIAAALNHNLRIGTYMIRRSRWLCLLTESSLAWEVSGETKGRKNLVTFQNGLAHFGRPIPPNTEIPVPPLFSKSRLARQNNFDTFTYDRMRIVTTELRRILGENRCAELLIRPECLLKSDQLRRILPWV